MHSGATLASALLRWETGCGANISIETLTKRRLRELCFNDYIIKEDS